MDSCHLEPSMKNHHVWALNDSVEVGNVRKRFLSACSDQHISTDTSFGSRYGWRNNLVYTFPGGVRWIFARFWISHNCFEGREGSHWIRSTVGIQNASFPVRKVEYGSSSNRFSWFVTFPEKLWKLLDLVLIVFSAQPSKIRLFEFWGPDHNDARTKSYADS